MTLEHQINEDLKQAMRAGDKLKVSVLRMLVSAIKNRKITDREQDTEMDDRKTLSVVQKMAKQHKESIEQFSKGGREDLVEKERSELEVLDVYLPEMLSEEAIGKIVEDALASTGASSPADMGKVMGVVMASVNGRADGKIISRIVREKLA